MYYSRKAERGKKMKNLSYGSNKVIKECATRVRHDQQMCDGMAVTAMDGSQIHVSNGVFCYNYKFDVHHSLDMSSFFNSLIEEDGEQQGIAVFRDPWNVVQIDAALRGGDSIRTNMYDVFAAFDRLMESMTHYCYSAHIHEVAKFNEAWDIMNDLQLYLDDVLHTKSYADAKIVGYQLITAVFNTIYEYVESGIAVIMNGYGDIYLPDVEAFGIMFCDHIRHIMTSTFFGDYYGVSE
jgi:hypothetical protein